MNEPSRLDLPLLEETTETLRAIAHPLRLAIIELLDKNREMNVTEIFESLDIQQAVASHHLRILKNKQVVRVKRDGQNSFYSLTDKVFFRIFQLLREKIRPG